VVYFEEPLAGLSAGAPVTFRGIEIGSVRRLAILGDPETFAVVMPVYLTLRPGDVVFAEGDGTRGAESIDVEKLVENGLRAQLRPRSLLTGQMAVDLDFFPDDEAHFKHPDDSLTEIPSRRSDFEQARKAVEEFPWKDTLDTVVTTLNSLESLTTTIEAEFTGIGDQIHATLDDSRELMGRSQTAIVALEKSALETLASLEAFSDLGMEQIRLRSDELEQVLNDASGTMAQIDSAAKDLEDLLHPRSPERDDLRKILRELTATSAAMRRFAEKVERRPNSLLFDGGEDNP